MHQFPWEFVIYGEYLASGGKDWFSEKNYDKWQRLQLPSGLYERTHLMAGKAKAKGNVNNGNNTAWINEKLTDDDILAIEQWDMSDGELFAGLMELQHSGHTISGKPATDGVGFVHFAIGVGADCANAGKGLSGYGSTPRDAAVALLYKHFIKFSGEWPAPVQGGVRRFG